MTPKIKTRLFVLEKFKQLRLYVKKTTRIIIEIQYVVDKTKKKSFIK